MYFELSDVVIWMSFLGIAALWWQGHAVKDLALKATRDYCESMGVQLLDDGLALRRLWVQRNASGTLCLRRTYAFEFTTTGEQRYHGTATMLGRRLDAVQLEPHRIDIN